MQKALALAEMAPRLRLIALVDTEALRAPEFADLVSKGLLHDFHSLPICHDRLMFSLGHIAGLVALESRENVANLGGAFPTRAMPISSASARRSPACSRPIRKFGEVDAPILVTGETGTGKELVARAIHDRSSFRGGPFVSINCAGLPTSIIESELFGYERGAFTGAIKQKIGRIEAARGGTLFLDEIGDLPLEVQGHLLRFLQEKTIERLGGTKSITVDTRVIAATNVSLEDAIKDGKFREDLYYRLNVLSIDMPPLRERGDDIQLLATYFLRKFSSELKTAEARLPGQRAGEDAALPLARQRARAHQHDPPRRRHGRGPLAHGVGHHLLRIDRRRSGRRARSGHRAPGARGKADARGAAHQQRQHQAGGQGTRRLPRHLLSHDGEVRHRSGPARHGPRRQWTHRTDAAQAAAAAGTPTGDLSAGGSRPEPIRRRSPSGPATPDIGRDFPYRVTRRLCQVDWCRGARRGRIPLPDRR